MYIGQSNIDFEGLFIEGPAGRFSMEPKVMALLAVLARNPNAVMTRETLITEVWGVEFGGDERLSRAISLLRKALGDTRGQHSHIETIPRTGYRLIATLNDNPPVAINAQSQLSEIDGTVGLVTDPDNPVSQNLAPLDKPRGLGFRAFAVVGLIVAAGLTLWLSPFGRSVTDRAPNVRIEAGLDHLKHSSREDAIPQAQVLFSGILTDDPEHASAQAGLALALLNEYFGRERDPAVLERAQSVAKLSIELSPHLALPNIAVAWVATSTDDYEKAHKFFDQADILEPDNLFALRGRAKLLERERRYDASRKIVDRMMIAYPDYDWPYAYAGSLAKLMNDSVEQEAMLRKALELGPENTINYLSLSNALVFQGKAAEAIEVLQKGIKVNETGALLNNLGYALYNQGHYEMAAPAFKRAIEIGDAHNYIQWSNLSGIYALIPSRKAESKAAMERALQLLKARLEKHPKDSMLICRYAMFNASIGRFDLARETLARVPFDTDLPMLEVFYAAMTYGFLDEPETAITMLERALDAGYPLKEILKDPELAKLREHPKFQLLLVTRESEKKKE